MRPLKKGLQGVYTVARKLIFRGSSTSTRQVSCRATIFQRTVILEQVKQRGGRRAREKHGPAFGQFAEERDGDAPFQDRQEQYDRRQGKEDRQNPPRDSKRFQGKSRGRAGESGE